jgi:hypothetical protein
MKAAAEMIRLVSKRNSVSTAQSYKNMLKCSISKWLVLPKREKTKNALKTT